MTVLPEELFVWEAQLDGVRGGGEARGGAAAKQAARGGGAIGRTTAVTSILASCSCRAAPVLPITR